MLTRPTHTTPPSLRETMTFEQYARNHARLLDVKAEPIVLQKWAIEAKKVIEELVKKGTV